jgi:hypothetical protein
MQRGFPKHKNEYYEEAKVISIELDVYTRGTPSQHSLHKSSQVKKHIQRQTKVTSGGRRRTKE